MSLPNHHSEPKPGGVRRIFRAALYSAQGLRAAWTYESSFRQEVMLLVVLFPLSIWIARDLSQWVALIATALLVLVTELMNSAVEAAVDRFGREHHELVGRAKDLGSASVFVSMLIFALVWGAIAVSNFLLAAPAN